MNKFEVAIKDSINRSVRDLVYFSVWRSIEILGCDLVRYSVRTQYK